jgi:hypothetical protein
LKPLPRHIEPPDFDQINFGGVAEKPTKTAEAGVGNDAGFTLI